MGQGCSSCAVGNPCTDPICPKYGSRHLIDLLEKVREKWEDFKESERAEERSRTWLENMERRFEDRKGISVDGFKYYAGNVRRYFDKPQPKIDALDSVEKRLIVCLDCHKEGELMECSNQAQELMDLASAGRDPPAHCKGRSDLYSCTFATTSTLGNGTGGTKANLAKSSPFGSCYS